MFAVCSFKVITGLQTCIVYQNLYEMVVDRTLMWFLLSYFPEALGKYEF